MSRVTILLPIYNALPFLKQALGSLFDQDIGGLTILALDDGSTDGSREYLESIDDPRVVISSSPTNLGLGATLDRGLQQVETEFFARMDADDLCSPSRIRQQMEFLAANPQVGIVGCHFHYFGNDGGRTLSTKLPLSHEGIARGLREGKLSIVHGSLVGRTSALREAGGYRLRGYGEDWDLFLRLLDVTCLANLPDDLYAWRLHTVNADMAHLMEQQLGIDYAIQVYEERTAGKPESTFAEFTATLHNRPTLTRWAKHLDVLALAHYRVALSDLSGGRRYRGLARLGLSASLSPQRTIRRITRRASSK